MNTVAREQPTLVMPWGLCRVFEQTRTGAVQTNEFPSGDSIRCAMAEDTRRSWRLARRCTPQQVAAVEAFYAQVGGPHRTFWFYDLNETAPRFRWDETAQETIGRYAVRFAGRIEISYQICRSDLAFEVIEVAA